MVNGIDIHQLNLRPFKFFNFLMKFDSKNVLLAFVTINA